VAAWRELARRLAHELKNPLFPLQVTVENLMRAKQKSPEMFEEVFHEGTATLLAEIDNLKNHRRPLQRILEDAAAAAEADHVNDVVRSVLRVFQAQLQEKNHIAVRTELADPLPKFPPIPICCIAPCKSGAHAIDAMPQGGEFDDSHRPPSPMELKFRSPIPVPA